MVGRDVLLLIVDSPDRVQAELAPLFAGMERLAPAPVMLGGRLLREIAVVRASTLKHWPPRG